jgi:hypothetical protein
MDVQQRPFSRFQVLSSGRPAWAVDRKRIPFYFDGFRFWRLTQDGGGKVMTSWQAPQYGWVHSPDCACGLCAPHGAAGQREERPAA